MTGETPNPLDVLRFYAVTSVDGNPTRYDIALAQVEALAEAAQDVESQVWDRREHDEHPSLGRLADALVPFSPPPL